MPRHIDIVYQPQLSAVHRARSLLVQIYFLVFFATFFLIFTWMLQSAHHFSNQHVNWVWHHPNMHIIFHMLKFGTLIFGTLINIITTLIFAILVLSFRRLNTARGWGVQHPFASQNTQHLDVKQEYIFVLPGFLILKFGTNFRWMLQVNYV